MDIIRKYFPGLDGRQDKLFSAMEGLYTKWNEQINVISRKDIHKLYEHHILHSLSIARVFNPVAGTTFLDFGTGGGFPGIPLAIIFPESNFLLVDSITKKIKVVDSIIDSLNITNVSTKVCRVEDIDQQFDFITARAVKNLPTIYPWIAANISPESRNSIPNGLLYLTGGDIVQDNNMKASIKLYPLKHWFTEEFFTTKILAHLYPQG